MTLEEFLNKVNNNDKGVVVKAIVAWDIDNVVWYKLQAQDDRTIEVQTQDEVEAALEQFINDEPEEKNNDELVEDEEDLSTNE